MGKAWPPNTPGAREAEGDIQQLTPTLDNNQYSWIKLGEQMQNTNEVTQRLAVGRHWRLARVYGGMARRNAMDSTGVTSVVSTCDTVAATNMAADHFLIG